MKILITGGHLSPVLSVIDILPKGTDVLLVGRKYTFEGDKSISFEYQIAQNKGIAFNAITTGRLQRTFTRYTLLSLFKFPIGFVQALNIVGRFRPDVILSFGGYVSVPVVFSAALLRIPIVVHEQTLTSGLANRIAAKFARKICISWESSRKYFSREKIILTGIPIRKFQISRLAAKRANFKFQISNEKLPLIYVTGGSAGSHTINAALEGCLVRMLEKFRIIHQTGDSWDFRDFDRLITLRKSLRTILKNRYMVTKFVDPQDVGAILQLADFVISRSGMNIVSELIYFGKPTLLIPLNGEQMKNARFLQSLGFANILSQDYLTSEKFYNAIGKVMDTQETYKKHGNDAKKMILPDAAENILSVVTSVIHAK